MYPRKNGRRGGITVFLCIILSVLIIIETIFISGSYQRKREVILTEAVSHQVEQILSQFDRDALNWYGIYVLDNVTADHAVFDRMTDSMDGFEFSYHLTDQMNNDDLRAAVSEFMRLRGLAFEGTALLDRLNISLSQLTGTDANLSVGVASVLPTLKEYVKNRKAFAAAITALQILCNTLGIGGKMKDFLDFMDELSDVFEEHGSAALQIGDSSVVVSVFDPACISSLTSAFDQYLDADLPSAVDRLLINEYAAFSFDSRVKKYESDNGMEPETNILGIPFSDIHGQNQCDLEYLLVGASRPIDNTFVASGLLIGTRLLLNMSAFLMDSTKRTVALGIAEVLSLLISIISLGTVIIEPHAIEYFILFIMAYIQSVTDSLKLVNGLSVPLFYNKKVTDTLGDFSDTNYRDYFRLFLLFVPEEQLLSRMRIVMGKDCGDLYTGLEAEGSLSGSSYIVKRRFELYENHV